MADAEEDLMDVVEQYVDKFGEGPPIFELEDEEAIALMQAALSSGKPMGGDE